MYSNIEIRDFSQFWSSFYPGSKKFVFVDILWANQNSDT